MPSRWFVPIPGVDPARVKLDHLHAAFSAWFDASDAKPDRPSHGSANKPWNVSPVTRRGAALGVELSALTTEGEDWLHAANQREPKLRLGTQVLTAGRAALLDQVSWDGLQSGLPCARWGFELLTPTTFRTGDNSSPLPNLPALLRGLAEAWANWAPFPTQVTRADAQHLWVSELELSSQRIPLRIRGRSVRVSAATGRFVLMVDPEHAPRIAPLLRLARYTGIGSMTRRGLGVVGVHELPS